MELLIALYATDIGFQPELIGWWMLWNLRIGLAATLAGGLFIGLRGCVRMVRS